MKPLPTLRVSWILTESWAALSDRRDLTKNLPLRIQPIIECIPVPIPPFAVELIGPLRDQNMRIIAGRHRLTCAWSSSRSRCLGW
jgi:hypothetical protein